MANVTEQLKFPFSLILISINLNLKSHLWLVATILDSAALNRLIGYNEVTRALEDKAI